MNEISKTRTEYLLERIQYYRHKANELSCKYTGIGSTGGFCLDAKHTRVGGNDCISGGFAKALARMIGPLMIVDLGCGLGQYGPTLVSEGVKWIGYDGAENVENVTKGLVRFLDLSEPVGSYIAHADWSMSIEVAEHIPRDMEYTFVYNVLSLCTNSTVVSWALPGQGGHHHVNLRSNSYVKTRFQCVGFAFDSASTQILRDSVDSCKWLRNTVMVFRKTHQTWQTIEEFQVLYDSCK